MSKGNKNKILQRGFMALISVILISAILMLIATSLSFSGFYARYNILDSEFKTQSTELAKSCIDAALIRLAHDYAYIPQNNKIFFGNDSCAFESVLSSSSQKIIQVQANYKDFVTNMRVVISPNFSITSREEVASF